MTLENKNLKDKISKLVNYYNVKNYEKLIEEANIILKKNPDIDILWNMLGLAYQQLGDYHIAEKKFLICLKVNPDNISAINNLGNNYKYIYNFKKAEEYFDKALSGNSNYIPALINYANLKFEFNKFKEALTYLNRALKIDSKVLTVHLNLALVHQSLGDFNKSSIHLKEINNLYPEFTQSDKILSGLINYKNDKEHLLLMEHKLNNLELNDNNKIQLYFALSKAYEDKLDFLKASQYFEKGNKLKRSKFDYDINKDKKLFQNIKDLFSTFKLDDTKSNDNKIIFVLGMPRSGTTLVEQIISAHKNIFGAGELGALSKLIYQNLFKKNSVQLIDGLNTFNNLNFTNIKDKYYEYVKNFNCKQDYITDKALLNFQWIGFIKILFPNSKIINCVREPNENCLSIYKNLFEHHGPWCYDKKELIEFYNLYQDLMEFWEDKYPNTIYNIKYENLILSPNDEIKKLINHLGIEWDKNCLKFHENKTAIKTLSVNQARKEIYSSSLGLYKNYKPFLNEFSESFDKKKRPH